MSVRILPFVAAGLLLGGERSSLLAQASSSPLTLGELYRQVEVASPRLAASRASARAATFRIAPPAQVARGGGLGPCGGGDQGRRKERGEAEGEAQA